MAILVPKGTDLYRALLAEGYQLPKDCGDIRLLMGVDSLVILQCDIHISGEDLAKVGRALVRVGERKV